MSTPSPTTVNVSPDPSTLPETRHVIIRLDRATRGDEPDLLDVARDAGHTRLVAFLRSRPGIRAQRAIRHASPQNIRQRETIASRSDFAPRNSLTSYWRLDARSEPDVDALVAELGGMSGEVELAYHETRVLDASPAAPSVVANPYQASQDVLNAAPQGIDARAAWGRVNGLGQNVSLIDLESAWIRNHEDIPAFQVLHGDNRVDNKTSPGDHGAAALSIIGAANNALGVVGIAPELQNLDAVSHYDADTDTELHVSDAIDAATKFLQPGDILALEVQRPQGGRSYPVEIDAVDLEAIRLACAQGIIVIEAAGNWYNNDLDAWQDPIGQHSLNPYSALFTDSGAIMVGASNFAVVNDQQGGFSGHERYYRSNYGQRIDCYALGEKTYAAGYGDLAGASGGSQSYTGNFGETSGATAVIAGAAALVQSWYKSACGGAPLGPAQMRAILSNPDTGTPQVNVNGQPIGVMPDLDSIMTFSRRLRQIVLCLLGRLGRLGRRPIFDVGQFESFKQQRHEQEG